MKKIIISSLIILLFISWTHASEISESMRISMKEKLDFQNWPNKNGSIYARVRFENHELSVLQTPDLRYDEIPIVYRISDSNVEHVCFYQYDWSVDTNEYLTVKMYVANSCIDAQDQLITFFIGKSEPSVPQIDNPAVAGDISFNNGCFFIRNNIVIVIYIPSSVRNKQVDIVQELDRIIQKQNRYDNINSVVPRFTDISFKKQRDRKAIITPYAVDPLGGTVSIKYHLGGGMIYQKDGDTIYYRAGEPGQYTIQFIAIAESGFTAIQTLKMTATDDDIFN